MHTSDRAIKTCITTETQRFLLFCPSGDDDGQKQPAPAGEVIVFVPAGSGTEGFRLPPSPGKRKNISPRSLCLSGEQMPVKTHRPNECGVVATVKQDEVLHFNSGQTGESGGVLRQTSWNMFM